METRDGLRLSIALFQKHGELGPDRSHLPRGGARSCRCSRWGKHCLADPTPFDRAPWRDPQC